MLILRIILITILFISVSQAYAENEPTVEEITYADYIYNNNFGTEQVGPNTGLVDLLSYYKRTVFGFTTLSLIIDTKKSNNSQAGDRFRSLVETFYSLLGGNPKELVGILSTLHKSIEFAGKSNLLLCQYDLSSFYCATTGCSFCKNPSFSDVQALFNHCWSQQSPWYCCSKCTR